MLKKIWTGVAKIAKKYSVFRLKKPMNKKGVAKIAKKYSVFRLKKKPMNKKVI